MRHHIARYFPERAIDAILDKEYICAPGTKSGPREEGSGRCALAVGLNALGLAVGKSPSATHVALALAAYHQGRVKGFNRWGWNALWQWSVWGWSKLDRARVVGDAYHFIRRFDCGHLLGNDLREAFGRAPIPRRRIRRVSRIVLHDDGSRTEHPVEYVPENDLVLT